MCVRHTGPPQSPTTDTNAESHETRREWISERNHREPGRHLPVCGEPESSRHVCAEIACAEAESARHRAYRSHPLLDAGRPSVHELCTPGRRPGGGPAPGSRSARRANRTDRSSSSTRAASVPRSVPKFPELDLRDIPGHGRIAEATPVALFFLSPNLHPDPGVSDTEPHRGLGFNTPNEQMWRNQ